jgi:hypothetical protein
MVKKQVDKLETHELLEFYKAVSELEAPFM